MYKSNLYRGAAVLTGLLLLTGCSSTDKADEAQTQQAQGEVPAAASIDTKGRELADISVEMLKNEAYLTLLGTPENDVLTDLRSGDYSAAPTVYTISIDLPPEAFYAMVGEHETVLPPALDDHIEQRYSLAVANYVNGEAGAEALAAASMTMAQSVFVDTSLGEGESTYRLYVYPEAAPMLVSFYGGQNGAVLAQSNVLVTEKRFTQTAEIEEYLKGTSLLSLAEITVSEGTA